MHAMNESSSRLRPELVRSLPVPGTWAYVDRLDVAAGSSVGVHVCAPAAHEIELVRLGLDAVIDPAQSIDADRKDARVLATVNRPASPQTISPGSYIYVAGEPVPAGTLSLGLWIRLWKIPAVDVTQVAWQALMTDIDYPDAARFGLVVDHLGRIGMYAGDGGAFQHKWLHMSQPVFAKRLGQWVHVAASWRNDTLVLFVNGKALERFAVTVPVARRPGSPAAHRRDGRGRRGGRFPGRRYRCPLCRQLPSG